MPAVFVSYTENDRRLVDSLAKVFRTIVPKKIEIRYSGERAGNGGPAPGRRFDSCPRSSREQMRS